MKIREQYVSESQIEEVVRLLGNTKSLINLDKDDVMRVLVGKEGILYLANQEEGMENSTFMKEFFLCVEGEKGCPRLYQHAHKHWYVNRRPFDDGGY